MYGNPNGDNLSPGAENLPAAMPTPNDIDAALDHLYVGAEGLAPERLVGRADLDDRGGKGARADRPLQNLTRRRE